MYPVRESWYGQTVAHRATVSPLLSSDPALIDAAVRLHSYLRTKHYRAGRLVGPDSGVRLNYRIGRFAKSYLGFVPWNDDLYYLQAQGYWTLANWLLFDITADERYRRIAVECCEAVLASQRDDGSWPYPHPEWRGRVTTYEGAWAAFGLLESFRRLGEPRFEDGVRRWHAFMDERIGYQAAPGGLAANYFADRKTSAVPNASADAVRFLAEVGDAFDEPEDRERCARILGFLATVQTPEGELPYEITTDLGAARMAHFQCFQYNAFEALGLIRYFTLTRDRAAVSVIQALLRFVVGGVTAGGHVLYQCGASPRRRVTYHAAAVAAALAAGTALELAEAEASSARAYRYVVSQQRDDGSFAHSVGDYGVLSDRRVYPRNLAMILLHLLSAADVRP